MEPNLWEENRWADRIQNDVGSLDGGPNEKATYKEER